MLLWGDVTLNFTIGHLYTSLLYLIKGKRVAGSKDRFSSFIRSQVYHSNKDLLEMTQCFKDKPISFKKSLFFLQHTKTSMDIFGVLVEVIPYAFM